MLPYQNHIPMVKQLNLNHRHFFSKVTYDFREKDSLEWQKNKPERAGNYEVMITTTQIFGGDKT